MYGRFFRARFATEDRWRNPKVKIRLLLFLTVFLLLLSSCACAEQAVLYNGIITRRYTNSTTTVYASMDKDSKQMKYLNPGTKIQITAIHPGWVEIKHGSGVGYVLRNRIDVTETVDEVNTPPYPVAEHHYYALIDRTVEIKSDKSAESDTLSVMTDGGRIAILGIEDGWAKLIYHRQYGYVDTRELAEIYPVAGCEEVGTADLPISVFTSYYSDNQDRINNLAVACAFISKVIQPGETMNFNDTVGPFNAQNGYLPAPVLVDGELKSNYGGGSCQVSSTLWDTLMQLPGVTVLMRKPHGDNAASYLPHGMDASSGVSSLNFIFRNDYDFPIRIDASTHDHALFIAVYKEM